MKKTLSLFLALIVAFAMIPLSSIGVSAVPSEANELLQTADNADATTTTLTGNVDFTGVSVTGEQFLNLTKAVTDSRIVLNDYVLNGLNVTVENKEQFLALNAAMQGSFTLANDIDLGDISSNKPLITLENTEINGAGHTVSGFELTDPGNPNAGSLFAMTGTAGNKVTISNICFGSAESMIRFNHAWGTRRIAVVVGEIPAGTSCEMNAVSVYVNMKDDGSGTNNKYTGALVGWANGDISMTGCQAHGTVDSWSQGGNAMGTGGLIGVASGNVMLKNCSNYTSVTGGQKVGGLIGSALKHVTVMNCANYGDVTSHSSQAGGLIGDTWNSNNDLANNFCINGFTNYGAISGTANISGLIGEMYSKNKTVKGTLTITNSQNCGSVTATAGHAGGFFGWANITDELTIENCMNSGTISGIDKVGGMIGRMDVYTSGQTITFRNSGNYGTVTTKNSDTKMAGGFVGETWTSAPPTGIVENCANYGNIAGDRAGGFAGSWKNSGSLTVTGFLNTGDITGWRCAAIVGEEVNGTISLTITNAINLGSCSGNGSHGAFVSSAVTTGAVHISGCLNAGTITSRDGAYALVVRSGNTNDSFSDNFYYVPSISHNSNNGNNGATPLETWSAVLEKLNTEIYSEVWGNFKTQNADGTGAVQAEPVLKGCQLSQVKDQQVYSVRLVAGIQNTLEYKEVGIIVTAGNGEPLVKKCTHVYKTITAGANGGEQVEYTASELGAGYLFALTVENIPVEGTVVLTVQPYAQDTNAAATRYLGTAYTVTFENGVLVNVVPVIEA